MKVLIVGDWHSDLHEEEVFASLKRLQHEVYRFGWSQYFINAKKKKSVVGLLCKIQLKYIIGPIINKLNKDLIVKSKELEPDIIFLYRGTHILSSTIDKLKFELKSTKIVSYNNDDPFSKMQPKYYWRYFKRFIPKVDLVLAYRKHNIAEFKNYGAKKVELMRSWYVPSRNFHVDIDCELQAYFTSDIVFVGHYEPDERFKYLEEIVKSGFNLKIFGPPDGWNKVIKKSQYLRHLYPIKVAWGGDYNRALSGAKIALCFLSKLNRDTYTRRCFEIPATNTMLLSQYTDDLASMYKEGLEAEYFRDCNEMLNKISFYLKDENKRKKVAMAGMKRLKEDGHDIDSRMRDWLGRLSESTY